MPTGWKANNPRRTRLPKDWHARRARVLKRDGHVCHVCRQPGADQVDHVRPGDQHDESNLAAIHRSCHARKSSSEGGAASGVRARARRAARLRTPEKHPGKL